MKHVRQIELSKEDMELVVDIVPETIIKNMIRESTCVNEYKNNQKRDRLVHFLQYNIQNVEFKGPLRRFYRSLNDKILLINSKLKEANIEYEEILKAKKLRELRALFGKVNLKNSEMKAIPILLKCMDIEYSNNIAFMLENELYIRSRIDKERAYIKKEKIVEAKEDLEVKESITEVNKLLEDIRNLEDKIKIKNNTILTLDEINKELQLELESQSQDIEIEYFEELTTLDYTQIIRDLGEHSSKIKEQFKSLLEAFEEDGSNSGDQLYELWMKWTDDEVTVIDRVLKKSMYQEKIKRSDINDLEDISENIMNRHLLSRIVLHLIYRRMASQCFEEAIDN